MKWSEIKSKLAILFILLLIPFLISCDEGEYIWDDDPGSNPYDPGDDPYDDDSSYVDIEELLRLVNEVREEGCRCGLSYYGPVDPVVWDDKLEEAAQNHSDDMSDNNFFSHTGSDGSITGDRLDDVGYDWMAYGENIAMGYRTEESVIEAWLNSPGHCRNIMSGSVTEMGVARNGVYWTQVFASPRW